MYIYTYNVYIYQYIILHYIIGLERRGDDARVRMTQEGRDVTDLAYGKFS